MNQATLVTGSKWNPVLSMTLPPWPPHTSRSSPVHTAVWSMRPAVGPHVQESATGSYRPPIVRPETTITCPVQIAVCWYTYGAPCVEVGLQESDTGSYRPPVLKITPEVESSLMPPNTTIEVPAHTAVWSVRGVGALTSDVGNQLSVRGSYRPPEFTETQVEPEQPVPPHTIIRSP